MAYPDKPAILTSYTAAEQALGDGSLPGQELDTDLANLQLSTEQVIDFIKLFARSDGKLANGIVTQESLAASIRIGFDPPEVWAPGQAYTTRSTVFQGFGFYLCVTEHTSGVFATDLGAGRWQLLADLTPPGGALIAANNLSDLADAAAGRGSLGLGTMATAAAGTAGTQFRNNNENDARFQPVDADLTAIAGLTSAADRVPYYTGAGTAALATLTAAGRAILDDADAAAQRTTLGAQAADATLTSLSGLSLAEGDILYATAADTLARLPKGTAGQVLRINAGATAPEWAATGFVVAANFNAIPASGTYSRTGTLVTVTLTGHGMTTGMQANLDFTTGTATDGSYSVTVVDPNTFTVTDAASGATSGNVTRNLFIRKSTNVASITDNGLGDYTINFTTALADANYYVTGVARRGSVNNDIALKLANGTDPTTTAVRVATTGGTTQIDGDFIHVAIFA